MSHTIHYQDEISKFPIRLIPIIFLTYASSIKFQVALLLVVGLSAAHASWLGGAALLHGPGNPGAVVKGPAAAGGAIGPDGSVVSGGGDAGAVAAGPIPGGVVTGAVAPGGIALGHGAWGWGGWGGAHLAPAAAWGGPWGHWGWHGW